MPLFANGGAISNSYTGTLECSVCSLSGCMHACILQCAQRTHRCVSLLPICPIWLSTNLSMTHVQRRQRRRRQRGSGRSGAGDGASAESGTGPSSVADSDTFGSDEEVCCEQIEAWIHEIVLCVKHWLLSLLQFDIRTCL